MDFLLSQQHDEREEKVKEKSGLSVDTLTEQHRISDLRAAAGLWTITASDRSASRFNIGYR